MAQKVNITIGRFQPFTQGHLNMVMEGELPCIVYRINSSKAEEDMSKIKVKGKVVKKDNIKNVIDYLDNDGQGNLNDTEKEVLKRPFTNELIEKELEFQLNRLRKLGDNSLNSAEGIVFVYKGRLMKCTGSFAAVNQILGLRFNM